MFSIYVGIDSHPRTEIVLRDFLTTASAFNRPFGNGPPFSNENRFRAQLRTIIVLPFFSEQSKWEK